MEKKKLLQSLQNPLRVQKKEKKTAEFSVWANSYYCLAPGWLYLCLLHIHCGNKKK